MNAEHDIVRMLRAWAEGADQQGVQEVVEGLKFAADEIERLRELLKNSYEFTKTLTAERDEARREVCVWQGLDTGNTARETASIRGWDCFKEDGK
jgi:hypothetical protein